MAWQEKSVRFLLNRTLLCTTSATLTIVTPFCHIFSAQGIDLINEWIIQSRKQPNIIPKPRIIPSTLGTIALKNIQSHVDLQWFIIHGVHACLGSKPNIITNPKSSRVVIVNMIILYILPRWVNHIQRIPENRKLPYPASVYCFTYGQAEEG